MPQRESDALSAAMAATDAELFASALGSDTVVHDETGNRSLEQQDDGEGEETEVEAEAGADDADGDGKTEVEAKDGEKEEGDEGADKGPQKDPKTGKFVKAEAEEGGAAAKPEKGGLVPPARLREATEKTKAAEAREAALNAQLAEERQERQALRAQMDLLARQIAQRQQVEQPKPQPAVRPDKFADPEGYDKWVEDQIANARNETRDDFTKRLINMNLANTREVYKEKFDAAYQGIIAAAESEPEARIAIQRIWHSPNPGAELMRWHTDRETLREVGSDPASYRKKIADETRAALLADPEFRKEIVAGLRAEAGGVTLNGNATLRHVTRVPSKQIPSLNGASGSAQLTDPTFDDDASEQGFFNRALGNAG